MDLELRREPLEDELRMRSKSREPAFQFDEVQYK
jgi:hypothetical protein